MNILKKSYITMIIGSSFLLSGCQVLFGVACTSAIVFNSEYRYNDIELKTFSANKPINEHIELGRFVGAYPYHLIAKDGETLPDGFHYRFYYKNSAGLPIYLDTERELNMEKPWNFADIDKPIIYLHLEGQVNKPMQKTLLVITQGHRTMCGNTDTAYRFKLNVE